MRGVDKRGHLVLVLLEDEQPAEHPNLVTGETDAGGVLHQPLHPLDEPAQVVVEVLHVTRGHLQHRVGVLPDL
jgi:hypothetical protein